MACLPSTCPFCACGCGLLLQEEHGRLIASFPSSAPPDRSNLCIRGWHCTGAVTAPDRLAVPLIRGTSGLVAATWQEAVSEIAGRLRAARFPPLFAVGPSVASEDAAAVLRLAEQVDARTCVSDLTGALVARRAMERVAPGSRGLDDPESISTTDLAWVIGFDAAECPQVANRLAKARRRGATIVPFDVFLAGGPEPGVTLAPGTFGDLGPVLGQALEAADDGTGETVREGWGVSLGVPRALVGQLRGASRPVIIIGGRWLTFDGADRNTIALLRVLASIGVLDRIVFAVGESNSWGVLDVLGSDVPEAEVECREEDLDTLVVVADDLVRRSPRPGTMAERLSRLANLIVIDRFPTDTTALAHVVLPSCTFAEADAWVTNLFGEARPWRRIVTPPGDAVPERIWIERIEALAPLASRASSPGAPPTPPASARLRPTPASLATMARQAGSTEFPHLLLFSSPAASFSTGVMSSRDEILQREAGEPVVMASPGTLEAAELKPGCAARLVVPGGEATLMVRADRRLPDSVLVLVALPGSTAAGLRGRYPGKAGTVGLQPVPARLERA